MTKEKRYYDKIKRKGLVKRGVICHPDDWERIKAYAEELKSIRLIKDSPANTPKT